MAIRDIVTMGYGSFSLVRLIPVLGYGAGAGGIMRLEAQDVFVPGAVAQNAFSAGQDIETATPAGAIVQDAF